MIQSTRRRKKYEGRYGIKNEGKIQLKRLLSLQKYDYSLLVGLVRNNGKTNNALEGNLNFNKNGCMFIVVFRLS